MHEFRQCKQATPAECPGCGCVCLYLCDVLSQGKAAEGPLPVSYPQLQRPEQVYYVPFAMNFMDYNLFSFLKKYMHNFINMEVLTQII